MKTTLTVLASVALLPVIAGCGASSGKTTASSPSAPASTKTSGAAAAGVEISSATVSGLGTVLVNGHGKPLYMFAPDDDKKVTCVGSCAAVWPPVRLSAGQKPVAAGEVRSSLLGSDPDPEGGEVVTYAGWPLYTYVADSGPGAATGQALDLNGGYWYVIAPSGTVVHTQP